MKVKFVCNLISLLITFPILSIIKNTTNCLPCHKEKVFKIIYVSLFSIGSENHQQTHEYLSSNECFNFEMRFVRKQCHSLFRMVLPALKLCEFWGIICMRTLFRVERRQRRKKDQNLLVCAPKTNWTHFVAFVNYSVYVNGWHRQFMVNLYQKDVYSWQRLVCFTSAVPIFCHFVCVHLNNKLFKE